MKRLITILTLVFLLTGCRSIEELPRTPLEPGAPTAVTGPEETVDLMPNASPETSGLALYVYDGQTVSRAFLFDDKAEEEILQAFHKATVQPVALNTTELKAPYYGLEIGGTDGFTVCGLWSDGYFITGTGETYAFAYDFGLLEQNYPWENPDTFSDTAVMPCAYYAARHGDGWNTNFLTAAGEPSGQKGVSMELVSASAEKVVVKYVNRSLSEWSYGLSKGIEVLSDGVWYNLPMQKDYAVISIAMLVGAGQSREQDYSLQAYGQLPSGSYRLVSNGLSVEFEIP